MKTRLPEHGPTETPRFWRTLEERIETPEAQRAAQDELVQAGKLAVIGQLLAGIAHELNQPLQVVSMYSELLLSNLSDGDPTYLPLRNVQQSVDRIAMLTRQIMQVSRYEAKDYLNTRIVDIRKSSERAA